MRHASRVRSAGGLTLRAQPPPCTGHQRKEHRTPPPARVTQESQASVRRPSELAGSPALLMLAAPPRRKGTSDSFPAR